jgi:GxxExxY protein
MNHRDTETQRREEEKDPLTEAIMGAEIDVHREIGPGVLELVYQNCLEVELSLRRIPFQSQVRIPLVYKGRVIDDEFITDLYFPGRLVVELKAVEKLLPIHEAQLLTYLRLSKTRVGLLLNFNVPVLKNGVKRLVL